MIEEQYEILEKVYEGGVATSYRARDKRNNRIVLLKILSSQVKFDKEISQRFRREAKIQSQLINPHIVSVYDFGQGDEYYIAFEYIEGKTLRDLINENKTISARLLRTVIGQVIDALCFAHSQGVIHRDLKPENILIATDGTVKITDFGLAFAKGQMEITEIGTVLGTPAYMSPEQTRGKRVDHKTDVFAVGVIIYECLTGENPLRGETYADTMSRVLHHIPAPLAALVSSLPPEFTKFIDRMLDKDPQKRPERFEELREHLRLLERPMFRPRLRISWLLVLCAGLVAIFLSLTSLKKPASATGPIDTLKQTDSQQMSIDTLKRARSLEMIRWLQQNWSCR